MPIDRRVFCAATAASSPPRHGRNSKSRSRAWAAPSCRSPSPAFAMKTAPASPPRRSSAPISSAAAPSAASTTRPTSTRASQPAWGEWRARAADALGGRLGRAPGRRPLRPSLQALGRGQGRRPRRPEQRRRGGRGAPRRASHRRLRLREADRREGRVLDPDRLRHAGRLAAHAAGRRCRRRQRPGRAQQRPADHLAGLVAERQGARLRLVREAEGGGLRARPWPPASAGRSPTSAARTAPPPGRTTGRRSR